MSILDNVTITRHIDVQERLEKLLSDLTTALTSSDSEIKAKLLANFVIFENELAFDWDARIEEVLKKTTDECFRRKDAETIIEDFINAVSGIDKTTHDLLFKPLIERFKQHREQHLQENDPSHKFTVLLLYPDYIASQYGEETYLAHVKASSAEQATEIAQKQVTKKEDMCDSNHTDFFPLMVLSGWHNDLGSEPA